MEFGDMKSNEWKVVVEPVDAKRFHAALEGPNGEEVWCDGCCVDDERLAIAIANNMHASFKAGWEAAMQSVVTSIVKEAPFEPFIVHTSWVKMKSELKQGKTL